MKYLTRQEILILLTILQLNEKAYLVTIRKRLKELSGKNWTVGSVYVPLDRLYRLGYLDIQIGEPNALRGRNKIKYYRLTEMSMQALSEIKKENDLIWQNFPAKVKEIKTVK